MNDRNIDELRTGLEIIDVQLLHLLNERAALVQQIGQENRGGHFDPDQERRMLAWIVKHNTGPFGHQEVFRLFKEIFKGSLDVLVDHHRKNLLVSRESKMLDTMIDVGGVTMGGGQSQIIAGPCAVESEEQVICVAESLRKNGISLIRGGAYKPRTSPYDFQGLGREGLRILRNVADRYDLKVVSELTSVRELEMVEQYVDVVQVGARNMQNYELLKAVGAMRIPILLKRGIAATIEEFLLAAEYIVSGGNENVILCERGIRTFEKWTRNTLDISSVPILKKETHLPVFVDVSHSTGRRDILLPCARAAFAAGADGVMIEIHPNPDTALSDVNQQIDLPAFDAFIEGLQPFLQAALPIVLV